MRFCYQRLDFSNISFRDAFQIFHAVSLKEVRICSIINPSYIILSTLISSHTKKLSELLILNKYITGICNYEATSSPTLEHHSGKLLAEYNLHFFIKK